MDARVKIIGLVISLWCMHVQAAASSAAMYPINAYKVENEQPAILKKNLEMALSAGKKLVFDSVETQAKLLKKLKELGSLDSYFVSKLAGAGGLVGFEWLTDALKRAEKLVPAQQAVLTEKIKQTLDHIEAGKSREEIMKDVSGIKTVLSGGSGGKGGGSGTGSGDGSGGDGDLPLPSLDDDDLPLPPSLDDDEGSGGGSVVPVALKAKKTEYIEPLSTSDLAALSAEQKGKSDALFLQKLRELSRLCDFTKQWTDILKKTTTELLSDVRKKKEFYQRAGFDDCFMPQKEKGADGKEKEKPSRFESAITAILTRGKDVSLLNHLKSISANLQNGFASGSGKEIANLLRACLFDPKKLDDLEEDIIRYLGSLGAMTRGPQPDSEKTQAAQQLKSDIALGDLFKKLGNGEGVFQGKTGKALLKQFMREANLLRLNHDFLKYQALSEEGTFPFKMWIFDVLSEGLLGGEITEVLLDSFVVRGLFDQESFKALLKSSEVRKKLLAKKVFDLNSSIEALLKAKKIAEITTQLPTIKKGLENTKDAREGDVQGLMTLIRDKGDAQEIIKKLETIAGWIERKLADTDKQKLEKELTEGRARQELKEGVEEAIKKTKSKLASKEDIAPFFYEQLMVVKGIDKAALRTLFANQERTRTMLKEFFTRTLKIQGLNLGALDTINSQMMPFGIMMLVLKELKNYKDNRSKEEVLADVFDVMISPAAFLKKAMEWDPALSTITENSDELDNGWPKFKAQFEGLKNAVLSKDLKRLEKELHSFVDACGKWAQQKTSEQAQDLVAWKKTKEEASGVITDAMKAIARGVPLSILKELEQQLMNGSNEINGKNIIPALTVGRGYSDSNKLILKILGLFAETSVNKIFKDAAAQLRSNMVPAKIKAFDIQAWRNSLEGILTFLNTTLTGFNEKLKQEKLTGIRNYFDALKAQLDAYKVYLN